MRDSTKDTQPNCGDEIPLDSLHQQESVYQYGKERPPITITIGTNQLQSADTQHLFNECLRVSKLGFPVDIRLRALITPLSSTPERLTLSSTIDMDALSTDRSASCKCRINFTSTPSTIATNKCRIHGTWTTDTLVGA